MQNMKHRIFIAINLPGEIKQKIIAWQKAHWDLPMHWTRPESLHITVVFFGYVEEEELARLLEITRQTISQFEPIEIEFERIAYGSNYDVKPRDLSVLRTRPPRLIWLVGVWSGALEQMQHQLASALLRVGSGYFYERDRRHFRPHITLGRTDQRRWSQYRDIPWIDDRMSLRFTVKSVEIMESRLLRSGAEYEIIESVLLAG